MSEKMGKIIDLSEYRKQPMMTEEQRQWHIMEAAKALITMEDAQINREHHLRALGMLDEKGMTEHDL